MDESLPQPPPGAEKPSPDEQLLAELGRVAAAVDKLGGSVDDLARRQAAAETPGGDWYAKYRELNNRRDLAREGGQSLPEKDEAEWRRLNDRLQQEAYGPTAGPQEQPGVRSERTPDPPPSTPVVRSERTTETQPGPAGDRPAPDKAVGVLEKIRDHLAALFKGVAAPTATPSTPTAPGQPAAPVTQPAPVGPAKPPPTPAPGQPAAPVTQPQQQASPVPQPPRPSLFATASQQAVQLLMQQAAGPKPPAQQPQPATATAAGPKPPAQQKRAKTFWGGVRQTIQAKVGRAIRRSPVARHLSGIRQAWGKVRGAKTPAAAGRAAVPLVGKVGGAATAAVAALVEFGRAVRGAAEANIQAQRKFAESSAAMGAVLAQLDVRQTFREMEMGNRLAPSARNLAESTDRGREATKEAEITIQGVKNDVIALVNNRVSAVVEKFNPLFRAANKYLGYGPEDDAKRTATAQDIIQDMDRRAKETDKQGIDRINAVRGHDWERRARRAAGAG